MERPGATTLRGDPKTLIGPELKPGDQAPDFQVVDTGLKPVSLADSTAFRALDLAHGTLLPATLPPAPRFAVASAGMPGKARMESSAPAELQQHASAAYATQTEKVFDANRRMNLRVASVEQEANVPMVASVLKSAAVPYSPASRPRRTSIAPGAPSVRWVKTANTDT